MSRNKETAILKMNEYGKTRIPFLFIIDFEALEPIVLKLDDAAAFNIFYDIEGVKNFEPDMKMSKKVWLKKFPIPFDEYKKSFELVMREIDAGNTYLINLTFPTRIECNFSLEEIFLAGVARYKLLYGNSFVVFSPETFVKIEEGIISSYPMKGTIDAAIPNAGQIILNDKKETAEHTTIVDLIRNDLSIVAKNVRVENFRYIEKIVTNNKTLLQVSSKITGRLSGGFENNLGEIIFKLLPAGSISGAPKKKTVEIIRKAEISSREFYTGIFGCFDGKKLNSAVMIRFIENKAAKFFYRSGGGITFMSSALSEYQELLDKIYVPIT